MTMAIKRFTRLEMSFNAVERVVEFMEIEQEPPAIAALRPPQNVNTCFILKKIESLIV